MRWITLSVFYALLSYADADFESYRNVVQRQSRNKTFVKLFEDHVQIWNRDSSQPLRSSFPCAPIPSPKPTTSAHTLTASNVDVVAAMGDSITAGNGIKAWTVIGLLIENRGLSYSIGGVGAYEQHLTVANIIKKYDLDVKGFSTGNGNRRSCHAHLNLAVPGAKSGEMKTQAERLVNKMQNEPGVDYENDWKVITIFIGGNDLCDYCHNKEEYSPARYVDNVKQALDVLIAHIPRAFVNLVPVLNITMMTQLNQNLVCDVLHLALCDCAAFPWNSAAKKELEEATTAYHNGLKDLVESGIYDIRDDFTVVIQPFFTETPLPRMPDGRPDLGYFAPDCFHLSQRGHEAAATALWNNMLEPVGQKKTAWQPGDPTHCLTQEDQYFKTYKNSPSYSRAFGKNLGVKKLTSKETRNGIKQDKVTSPSSTTLIVGVCLCVFIATGVAIVVYRKVSSTAFKNKNMYIKL